MQIKRARLVGVRDLIFEEQVIDDADLAPTSVLAETECSAVSVGTELAAYTGEPPLRPGPIYPRLVGYCNAARVLRVGTAVSQVQPGQYILTRQSHQSGFVCDVAEILAPLQPADSPEGMVLSYCAQLSLSALQKGRFQAGETVAVLGLGVIGLAAVALSAALGARVLAFGNAPSRLARATELGADASLDSSDPQIGEAVAQVTGGAGPDLVLTTANSWNAWRTALEISRFQTRIAVLGFPGRSEGPPSFNPLDSAHFYQKQLSILGAGQVPDSAGSATSPQLRRNMETILHLVRSDRLPLRSLITHRVPWHDLKDIYEIAAQRDKSLIGAILNWRCQS